MLGRIELARGLASLPAAPRAWCRIERRNSGDSKVYRHRVVLRVEQLSKLGEYVSERLEVIPRRWKVIQMVREKLSCQDCQMIACALPHDAASCSPSHSRASLETQQRTQQGRDDVLGHWAIRLVPRLNGWCENARVRNTE